MKRLSATAALAISAVSASVVLAPRDAAADYHNHHASRCVGPEVGVNLLDRDGSGQMVIPPLYTTGWRLFCPVDDDSERHFSAMTNMEVFVFDNASNSNVVARACVSFFLSIGGACGPDAATTNAFTGWQDLHPDLTIMKSHPDDFAYVFVKMNMAGGRLSGYTTWYP